MPPFDWQSDQPRHVVDLQSMVREFTPVHVDLELQLQLAAAARAAIQRQWSIATLQARPQPHGSTVAWRISGSARWPARRNALTRTPEALDVVTKALVKRLFHRYAESLRQEQEPALIAVTEELFAFDAD